MSEDFIVLRNDTYYYPYYGEYKLVEQAYQIIENEIVFLRDKVLVDDYSNATNTGVNSTLSDLSCFMNLAVDPNPINPLTTLTLCNTTSNGTYVVK